MLNRLTHYSWEENNDSESVSRELTALLSMAITLSNTAWPVNFLLVMFIVFTFFSAGVLLIALGTLVSAVFGSFRVMSDEDVKVGVTQLFALCALAMIFCLITELLKLVLSFFVIGVSDVELLKLVLSFFVVGVNDVELLKLLLSFFVIGVGDAELLKLLLSWLVIGVGDATVCSF